MSKPVLTFLSAAIVLVASNVGLAQPAQQLQAPQPQGAPPSQPPPGYGQSQPPAPPAGGYGQQAPTYQQPYQQPHPQQPQGHVRQGFTFELTLGVGHQILQADSGGSDSATLLSGLNLGIGGFISPDLGILFRVSGTNVEYGSFQVVSAVAGVVAQYWPSDYLKLEAGPGFAIVSGSLGGFSLGDDRGFGFILSAAGQFFEGGGHGLQLGVEYAPGFFEGGTVHNIGFTFGWQMF